ncbi:nucleotide sugar dehydrogenase [Bacillus toyonensis]|nr:MULTISPECIES: nucleotide sugar dehydrogenase [Bacillus]EEL19862.1 Nucleotide sugar dehydrogenase [Bacillus cereus Rock1-3]KXY15905.1 UDP-N-acetyl-D-glucosamine dehydrogenase [Bacillus cereus]MDH8705364.1 UDP-N-acetyl-D-glucosamine dehydrogenase [Stenotrophomonas sp. 1198]MDP9749060.1 UDP-N-acetyl-D-glucosamine dehydrogenase [Bacillus thuringiensis]KAB2401626.1 nucleotide sugar dehydrogenase [Bacillus toyonensis]
MNNYYRQLREKIKNHNAKVGVIGLGYVGLPLAVELSKSGYVVYGIDLDNKKIDQLLNGNSYIMDISNEEIEFITKSCNFTPTSNFEIIKDLDAVSICVPTPLTKFQEPDMSYIIAAMNEIKKYMHKGLLITLESTTYPGTTEELIEQELNNQGYIVGDDYFLCFSPERIDPGNTYYNTRNTPKVLGGTTKGCTKLGVDLYSNFIDTIVPVSSPKVAEMSKLLENTFRSVNIAFINEMAMLCDKLGVDIWETVDAANTKPFGFMKFTPGPGIGGHCIPLDPMYLAWKAKGSNFFSRFIDTAQEINKQMPEYVYNKVSNALNTHQKPIMGSRVLLLGMAYKPDIDDLRESPGLEVFELLRDSGACVEYNDPHARSFTDKYGEKVSSVELEYSRLSEYDCIILITNHKAYDSNMVVKNSKLIVDTRNAFKEFDDPKIIKIGVDIKK